MYLINVYSRTGKTPRLVGAVNPDNVARLKRTQGGTLIFMAGSAHRGNDAPVRVTETLSVVRRILQGEHTTLGYRGLTRKDG